MNKNKTDPNYKIIAENRRARYDYSIEDEIECGLSLVGSEVHSFCCKGLNMLKGPQMVIIKDGLVTSFYSF